MSTRQVDTGHISQRAFALPTILIASIILLTVLLASVASSTSVRSALQDQYYQQLASEAAESGIAYAQSCLAQNNSVITWSDANPLLPNTDCTGTVQSGLPSTVLSSGDIQTTFSVGASNGDISLQSSGTTNLLRTSTGVAYRSFSQTDEDTISACTTTTDNTPGWSNAVATTSNYSVSGATPITSATGSIPVGPEYFRKDFYVPSTGTYTLSSITDDQGETMIDGQIVQQNTIYPTAAVTSSITLQPGCHNIVEKLTNRAILPNPTSLQLTLTPSTSSTPAVVSDTSWRDTTVGSLTPSSLNYFEDSAKWATVCDFGTYNGSTNYSTGPSSPGTWATTTGNNTARWISTTASNSSCTQTSEAYPANSTTYYRDNRQIYVNVPTTVKFYAAADDGFSLYLDGSPAAIVTGSSWKTINSVSEVLQPGYHQVSLAVSNVAAGPSAFLFTAQVTAVGTGGNTYVGETLSESDLSWASTNYWSASDVEPTSTDAVTVPSSVPATTTVCSDLPGGVCNSAINMATNPSFESDTAGDAGGNSTLTRVCPGSGSGTPQWPANGSCYVQIKASGTSADSYAQVGASSGLSNGMVAGGTYTISATANLPTALTGSLETNRSAGIVIIYALSGGSAYVAQAVQAPNATGTFNLSLTFTIPTTATLATIRLYNGSTSGVVNWDGVTLIPGLYNFGYLDGNSPGWAWSGAPNDSTSSGPTPTP